MTTDTAKRPNDKDPTAESIEFKPYRDGYAVKFDYDPFLVAFLKKLPRQNRAYVKEHRYWQVDTDQTKFLAATARKLGYVVTGMDDE
jgi:hypothetical protein